MASKPPEFVEKTALAAKNIATGLSVTLKTMMRPNVTVQYPHEKEEVAPRSRGVIALFEENCTACMLCARECPDWCIYIEGHKYLAPPRREGAQSHVLQWSMCGVLGTEQEEEDQQVLSRVLARPQMELQNQG